MSNQNFQLTSSTQAGVTSAEILALNTDLQINPNMVANKLYRLPRSAALHSVTAVSDLIVEFRARKTEAEKAR